MTRVLLTLFLAVFTAGTALGGTLQRSPPRAAKPVPGFIVGGTGHFVPTGKLHAGRYGQSATRLQDGRVLIVEGGSYNGQQLHNAEIYDPASGTFSEAGSTWYKRTYIREGSALLPDGRVL